MTLPIDEGVGQIRDRLVGLGINRKTLVLFFSANSAAAYDFLIGSHAEASQGLVSRHTADRQAAGRGLATLNHSDLQRLYHGGKT